MTTDSALRELVEGLIATWRQAADVGGMPRNQWERGYDCATRDGIDELREILHRHSESILTAAGEAQPKPIRHSCETDMLSECPGCNADVAKPAPAGMVLVPRVMTEEMQEAWFVTSRFDESGEHSFQPAYAAMLSAAPTTPPPTLNEAFDQVGAAMMRDVCGEGAPAAQVAMCGACDGTGDVHRADGEWLGECPHCKKAAAQVAEPLDAKPDCCLTIPDWALARSYRLAVSRLDPEIRVSALTWASDITVAADMLSRQWSDSVKNYMADPRSLATWLRVHNRSGWDDMESRIPEILAIHEALIAAAAPAVVVDEEVVTNAWRKAHYAFQVTGLEAGSGKGDAEKAAVSALAAALKGDEDA